MKNTLIFCLVLLSQLLFSQVKFETNLKCRIAWGSHFIFEYHENIEEGNTSINIAELIKNDNRYLEESENVIIDFLISNLEQGNFIGLTNYQGDTLNRKQIFEALHWKWNIDMNHGDTIRWIELNELNQIRIHQEWNIDTTHQSISNKVLGISILIEEKGIEKVMVYIPFDNDYSSMKINTSEIVYIQLINTKYNWVAFPKIDIAKLLTDTKNNFHLSGNSNNPLNIHNEQTNKLDSLYQEIELFDKSYINNIVNHSEGIHLSQYLYINYKKFTVNTQLNSVAPLFGIYDYKGNFKYYKTLYWLTNKVVNE